MKFETFIVSGNDELDHELRQIQFPFRLYVNDKSQFGIIRSSLINFKSKKVGNFEKACLRNALSWLSVNLPEPSEAIKSIPNSNFFFKPQNGLLISRIVSLGKLLLVQHNDLKLIVVKEWEQKDILYEDERQFLFRKGEW